VVEARRRGSAVGRTGLDPQWTVAGGGSKKKAGSMACGMAVGGRRRVAGLLRRAASQSHAWFLMGPPQVGFRTETSNFISCITQTASARVCSNMRRFRSFVPSGEHYTFVLRSFFGGPALPPLSNGDTRNWHLHRTLCPERHQVPDFLREAAPISDYRPSANHFELMAGPVRSPHARRTATTTRPVVVGFSTFLILAQHRPRGPAHRIQHDPLYP
jgi:hypothetical protein